MHRCKFAGSKEYSHWRQVVVFCWKQSYLFRNEVKMARSKRFVSPTKTFGATLLSLLLLSSFFSDSIGMASAQEIFTSTNNASGGVQPLDTDGSSFYYYVDGSRVPLTLSTEWISVKFTTDDVEEQATALEEFNVAVATEDETLEFPHPNFTLIPVRDGIQKNSVVANVNSMRTQKNDFAQVNPVFQVADTQMVVTDQFIATFPVGMTASDIQSLNATHAVEMVGPILGQANTFILRVTSASPLDALGMANLYMESGSVLMAEPDFARVKLTPPNPSSGFGPSFSPDDSYYSDSWHLNNTGQYNGQTRGHSVSDVFNAIPADADIDAPEAWDIITGDPSVIIAIIDEGVDLNHEDLQANLVPGYDATGLGSAGGPSGDDTHGTATASLAAAVGNNNEGVTGVCMDCSIMPIRIAYSDDDGWVTTNSWIANGITWAYQNGASILSNSWGGGSSSSVINTAFTNAVTLGRGGLGSVVVVAAGNFDISPVEYPASLSYVIAVGATNMCDERKAALNNQCNGYESWWGSNLGSALDISAPGVFLDSADNTGSSGSNGGNYNIFFNGTSGATPIVAGVAGLVLSANPYITAVQVQTILQDNADDIVTAPASAGWDQYTGYGRVNAEKALQEAITGFNPIQVKIGNPVVGKYYLQVGQNRRVNYAGVDSGPVKVESLNSTQIISAIREAWQVTGITTSFSQFMGLPTSQLSDRYVFPGYNNVTLDEQLRISNVDASPSTVVVTIGGVIRGTYDLDPNEAVRINYVGLDSGPVIVDGTDGVNIIAAIREAWKVNGGTKSFVQLMGLPAGQLSDKYVFPAYNNVTLNEQLRIGNVDTSPSTVVVTIGGVVRGTYDLDPDEAVRINYAGLDSGPVIVDGTDGVNIISSIRDAWITNGITTSFSQLMGMPAGGLSDKYIFPSYNNVTLDEQLRIGNVDTVATTVTVTIGGILRGTYDLDPSEAVRINYAGLDSGPVVVDGTNGVKIISALRDAWKLDGVTRSFVQMMGLPFEQLSTTYLFPAYNNVTLNEQLRFAVP
jgi:thermitase